MGYQRRVHGEPHGTPSHNTRSFYAPSNPLTQDLDSRSISIAPSSIVPFTKVQLSHSSSHQTKHSFHLTIHTPPEKAPPQPTSILININSKHRYRHFYTTLRTQDGVRRLPDVMRTSSYTAVRGGGQDYSHLWLVWD